MSISIEVKGKAAIFKMTANNKSWRRNWEGDICSLKCW